MADFGGIGTGIGEGMRVAAQNLWHRYDINTAHRDKQADSLVDQMHAIRDNIAQVGMDSPEGQQLSSQLKATIEQHNALYGQHETPQLMDRIHRLFGKSQTAPQTTGLPGDIPGVQGAAASTVAPPGQPPSPEWRSFGQEMAGAKVPQNDILIETQNVRKTWRAFHPDATPKEEGDFMTGYLNNKLDPQSWSPSGAPFQNPDGTMSHMEVNKTGQFRTVPVPGMPAPTPKPLTFEYHPQTGGLTGISDPNTGKNWDASTVATAPPEIKARWDARQKQQEEEVSRKEAADAKKQQEIEERQTRALVAATERQAVSFQQALDKQDYSTAKKVVTDADNDYQQAIDRQRTMDQNIKDALRGDQQAMLSLVANHIGMTLGAQKGARITQAVWNEAVSSTPWLQKIAAKFSDEGYLSGVTLAPNQMADMVRLAHEKTAVLQDHKQRVEEQYKDALGLNKNAKPNVKERGLIIPGGALDQLLNQQTPAKAK